MENTNNINYWNKIKIKKENQPLIFIHTPKCGGKTAKDVFSQLNINIKGHIQAEQGDGIAFTIIRHPVERFESLMNYRLGEDGGSGRWPPKKLRYVLQDKSISLNQIVEKMSDKKIRGFSPYQSLCYWSKNIDIFITIDKLEEFLLCFGYTINLDMFEKKNVSKKERGTFNDSTKKRISDLYSDDMALFKRVILD